VVRQSIQQRYGQLGITEEGGPLRKDQVGKVAIDFDGGFGADYYTSKALHADGKIVIVGRANGTAGIVALTTAKTPWSSLRHTT
jgi:hypothetical protein